MVYFYRFIIEFYHPYNLIQFQFGLVGVWYSLKVFSMCVQTHPSISLNIISFDLCDG